MPCLRMHITLRRGVHGLLQVHLAGQEVPKSPQDSKPGLLAAVVLEVSLSSSSKAFKAKSLRSKGADFNL